MNEIEAYVEDVRRALAGIDPSIREELLEDLPEHLAEVLAEGSGTLAERLGPPAVYAAELLAAAGLVGGFPSPPPSRFASFAAPARDFVRKADLRIGGLIGYAKATDFLVLLRPAWWLLRGYLAAMAVAYFVAPHNLGLLPRIGDNDLVALILLGGATIGSILLGNRPAALSRFPRYALRAGTAFLIIFALAGFAGVDSGSRNPGYDGVNYDYSDPNPYSNVEDVYVYDGQGRLVRGARLYDQDGSPIQLGYNYCTDQGTGAAERSRSLGYPFCPENAPFTSPSPAPSPSR